jgi:protein-tyrosine-phosphatase
MGASMIMKKKQIKLVCFMCEWNEGRSPHLEMSVRLKLKRRGSKIKVISAGFSQADRVNPLRKAFLLGLGVPAAEIDAHYSTIFNEKHARADLILVAEMPMKENLLKAWPELAGRVMTVKGFIKGMSPSNEDISEEEARMEDAGGKDIDNKLTIYLEHECLAEEVANRLLKIEKSSLSST